MFIKSLLKLHRYRKFDYRPRYYDETRDKINELKIQKGYDSKEVSAASKFKRENKIKSWNSSRKISSSSGSSLRIAIIFVILCFMCYMALRLIKIV